MDQINEFLVTLDSYLGASDWFPLILLGTGVFFTLYLRFPQIRFFRHALQIVTGKFEKEEFQGDTTHFQALSTALSGTVGTGNIGGVGLAIYIGGPAALFWMWATAFFGMTTKFVECSLSHKYRTVDAEGAIAGGPMYYMERKLNMKWLAVIFAVATVICSFGTGNMPQINNIAIAMEASFGLAPWVTAAVLSVFLFLIIIGGIKRIARVTEKIVPFMAILYFIGALLVIVAHLENVIPSLQSVFVGAFTGSAAMGGFLGASFAYAFNRGVNRGIYSNEAGQGSAAIAHSAAKADEPVSEGMVAILEPFIDTLIICTLTGLTILASGIWTDKVPNIFQRADMEIIQGVYLQQNEQHKADLARHILQKRDDPVRAYSGELTVQDGRVVVPGDITIIHARSIAEDVLFSRGGAPVDGVLHVQGGQLVDTDVVVAGKSLVHSAVLTTEAFKQGLLGDNGQYIVSIGLMLFAFSTVISWSYYGDRAITYLLGAKFVLPYRLVYIVAFFAAALIDTTIVWSLAAVAIVLMAVPNLFGILLLHKDMKQSVREYWQKFKREHPEEA
ncbi:MAG: amino acid carrier protein, partial [Acidobacteria bacterium]|nr:amino acid carrier protein [Acidobacteriota bacterium]